MAWRTRRSRLLESLQLGALCPWSRRGVGAENSLSVRHIDSKLEFRPRHSARAALVRNYAGYLRSHCQPTARRQPLTHSAQYEGVFTMTSRKSQPALLYTSALAQGWSRALTACIDDGLAALCKRQWQQAPLVISRTTYIILNRHEGSEVSEVIWRIAQ